MKICIHIQATNLQQVVQADAIGRSPNWSRLIIVLAAWIPGRDKTEDHADQARQWIMPIS